MQSRSVFKNESKHRVRCTGPTQLDNGAATVLHIHDTIAGVHYITPSANHSRAYMSTEYVANIVKLNQHPPPTCLAIYCNDHTQCKHNNFRYT